MTNTTPTPSSPTPDTSAAASDPPDVTPVDTVTGRSDPTRRGWPRTLAVIAAVIMVLLAGGWLGFRWLQPYPYSGTVMQAPKPAPSMDGLLYSDGTPVDISDFEGDLLLVYFGYTSCPDVCPTTLSQVAAARRRLGDDADHVRLLFISVDPERDDLASLGDYAHAFDDSFQAATGDLDTLARVATQYGIFFAKDESLDDGYTINHTATLMGIGPDGHLRIVWPALLDVERLAADMRELL